MSVDCKGLAQPIVIRTKIMGAFGLHGAHYPGEPFVFIDPDAPAKTYAHEAAHFLMTRLNMLQSRDRKTRCANEEMARKVADRWAGDEPDDSWKPQYGCTPKSVRRMITIRQV